MKIAYKKHQTVNLLLGFIIATALIHLPISVATAQSQQEEIYVVADEMPVFPGGSKGLVETINKNVVYPADARERGIEGKVYVKFVVDKNGNAVNPAISKGLYPSIDRAVLEAIKKLPKFEPGKVGGKAVSVWYAVPVTFKILES